jgi:hypothetical protein
LNDTDSTCCHVSSICRCELGLGEQSRYFVLILVRHQLVQVARDRFLQRRRFRGDLRDELAVLARIRVVLISAQFRRAIERLRLSFLLRLEELLDGRRVVIILAAPLEHLQILLDVDAVPANRLFDRRERQRNQPALIRQGRP